MDAFVQEEAREAPEFRFATVAGVHEDGISLIFDGETADGTEPAEGKHYRCNTSVVFQVGDRVKICRDSGTYVVEYVVGAPMGGGSGGTVPPGGSRGQALRKLSGDDGDVGWQDVGEVPSGGGSGKVLTAQGSGSPTWETPRYLPTGGQSGQILTYGSSGPEWSSGSVELRVMAGHLQFNAGMGNWITVANSTDIPK